MSNHQLRVLIIGCGNIAGVFDQDREPSDFPLTHAGAFSKDSRFALVACVDPDISRRHEFMAAWNVESGYESIDELIDLTGQFDVISICSPTTSHIHDLEVALKLHPKLIFCEKPITPSLLETERLVAKCDKANILMAVNYTRRWDSNITKLQADIDAGCWGQLRSIIGTYNKGILNNGSHMIDLLHLLVGPMEIVKVGRPVEDYISNDPTVPVWLENEQGVSIHLVCGHAEDYSLFELQLIFSEGVLTMEDGGLSWRERRVIDSDTFRGYSTLNDGTRLPGEYPRAMLQAVDNIYSAIHQKMALASTGETALVAQRLCELVKRKVCSQL